MKYFKQFLIILAVCLVGDVLYHLLPLPIPASIYGMVLMFLALTTGIIKLHQVENVADFLVQVMPVLLLPASIGLMARFDSLRAILLPFLIINVVGFFVTFLVTGHVAQFFVKRRKGDKK